MRSAPFGRFSGQAACLGIAALLALAATSLGWIGWRAYGEVSSQMVRLESYRSLQRDAGKADSLSAVYASVLKQLQGIRAALPDQNQGSLVLNLLGEEARRADLAIAGITALDEIPFPGYRELPFELNLSGGFRNLVGYLRALETRGMVLQVRKVSVKAEAINKSRVVAKLELSVFAPGLGNAKVTPSVTPNVTQEAGAAP